MKTIDAGQMLTEGMPHHKFPHTGPVRLGTKFAAALKGVLLSDAMGQRTFVSEQGAIDAITEAAGEPVVGAGATVSVGSDRYACTVVDVQDGGRLVIVQADKVSPAEGHDYYNDQKWKYEPNPKGSMLSFRLAGGVWREVVRNAKGNLVFAKNGSYRLRIGVRDHYSDPSF